MKREVANGNRVATQWYKNRQRLKRRRSFGRRLTDAWEKGRNSKDERWGATQMGGPRGKRDIDNASFTRENDFGPGTGPGWVCGEVTA